MRCGERRAAVAASSIHGENQSKNVRLPQTHKLGVQQCVCAKVRAGDVRWPAREWTSHVFKCNKAAAHQVNGNVVNQIYENNTCMQEAAMCEQGQSATACCCHGCDRSTLGVLVRMTPTWRYIFIARTECSCSPFCNMWCCLTAEQCSWCRCQGCCGHAEG